MASSHNLRSPLGSKREIRKGVWQVRVTCGRRRDGKPRTCSSTVRGTSADADVEIVRLANEMGRSLTAGDPLTLSEYFWGVWLPHRKLITTRGNVSSASSRFRCHIEPDFGHRDMGTIGRREIQAWVMRQPPKMAFHYAQTLRSVLNQAAFDGIIAESPMGPGYRFRYPKHDTAPGPVWGEAEVAEAYRRLPGDLLWPLFLVMAGGGLSRSEALGLDCADVAVAELLGSPGHCRAQLSITKAYTEADGMKEPKNSRRYRLVPLEPLFADPLAELVEGRDGPLVLNSKGWRMSPGSASDFWKRSFGEGCKLNGLPYIPVNRLRATHATLMQKAGALDTLNNAIHGRSSYSQVQYTNYLAPDLDSYSHAQGLVAALVSGA